MKYGLLHWLQRLFGSNKTRVLIYGTGPEGKRLLNTLRTTTTEDRVIVAFIAEKGQDHDTFLSGYRVYPHHKLRKVIRNFGIGELVLTLPGDTPARLAKRKEIVEEILRLETGVRLRTPTRYFKETRLADIRDIGIEDMLGRETFASDAVLPAEHISGKSVLVTGAGGSIGRELCKQILHQKPSCLVLLEMNEHNLYQIDRELKRQTSVPCVPMLGSVLDTELVRKVFLNHRVRTVYHAASYKHVHLVEANPVAGARNNVMGTYLLAREAVAAGVETFIKISTDKAYRPKGVMGGSKRFAEMVLQAMAKSGDGPTRFTIVRFGNVLESSGSVVPLFREQIEKREKVTVTHPDATRYLMTLSEAVVLVLQAGAMGRNGDVLFLEMGQPVNILDLAKTMIRLAGRSVKRPGSGRDGIEIEIVGLRPGEKLHEDLPGGDHVRSTSHPGIFRVVEEEAARSEIDARLHELEACLEALDGEGIRRFLAEVTGTGAEAEVVSTREPTVSV